MFNTKPLGIKVFGVGNIIIGSIFFIVSSILFLLAVLGGWVSDRKLYGIVEWFCLVIVDRLAIAMLFVFTFQLIRSGIGLLIMNAKARKISRIASITVAVALSIQLFTAIIRSFVYPARVQISFSFLDVILVTFIFYTISLIIYLNRPSIRELFNDQNVKVSFIRPILIIIISFLFPFIVNLFFPVFPENLIFRP